MSQPVTVRIPHALGTVEAHRRIDDGFGRLKQQMTGGMGAMLALTQRWEGDRLSFEGGALGQKLSGRIDVLPDAVQIQIDLPNMLAALADRVLDRLRGETQKLLDKNPS